MAKGYILYNPLAGKGQCENDTKALADILDQPVEFYDMTRITNYSAFLADMEPADYLVIAGGDGTVNRFANAIADLDIPNEIYYFPVGTGNDFAHDLGQTAMVKPFPVSQYLKNLPSVEVNGKTYRFINGVGYGIDGYCCHVGDQLKQKGKAVNYTAIAIKGLLFHYNATNATVTVDGKVHKFEKVWIAPTMFGRFYGGGMMPTPAQDRANAEGKLSLMVFHGGGRLRTLMAFPSIFKGEHIKYTNMVSVLSGREITVKFDCPTPLQVDGETILDVTSYTARGAK